VTINIFVAKTNRYLMNVNNANFRRLYDFLYPCLPFEFTISSGTLNLEDMPALRNKLLDLIDAKTTGDYEHRKCIELFLLVSYAEQQNKPIFLG